MRLSTMLCRKKIVYAAVVAVILYMLLRIKEYTIKFDSVVRRSKPIDVWEFVADFSNMLKLNPTITDFHIHEERGDYRSWVYSVSYTEHLSQFPSVQNFAFAEFTVKPLVSDTYIIESTHKTCFLTTFACVNSKSSFTFEPHNDIMHATRCTEKVIYQCPVILSSFCSREVKYQRQKIAKNLQHQFNMKSRSK